MLGSTRTITAATSLFLKRSHPTSHGFQDTTEAIITGCAKIVVPSITVIFVLAPRKYLVGKIEVVVFPSFAMNSDQLTGVEIARQPLNVGVLCSRIFQIRQMCYCICL
jgi:hypothetical protein